jgi:enamine deaminase RidA (YjgF/YER057c/UK114 family)
MVVACAPCFHPSTWERSVPHRIVNPPEMPAPSGFSHAVLAGPGRTLFLAGQNGTDGSGAIPKGAGLVEQMDRALGNLLHVVQSGGGAPTDVVQLVLYVTDLAAYRSARHELAEVWRGHFGRYYPAMSLVGVAELFDPAAVVEIEGIAVLSGDALAAP